MQITSRMVHLKRIFLIPGESQPGETLYLLLLAFCYAAYFLLATIMFYSPGDVVETEEFLIYIQGWISVPILTLLALVGVRAFKQRYFQQEDYFYPLMVGISLLTSLIGVFAISLSSAPPGSLQLSNELSLFVLVLFPLIQVLSLWAIRKYRRLLAYRVMPEHIQSLNRVFPLAVAIFLTNFGSIFTNTSEVRTSYWVVLAAVIAGAVLRFNPFVFSFPNKRLVTVLVDALAVGLIALACFDPNLSIQILHENFYMGPVNALLHGKTILVDVYSQYGVFVMEFLAALFKLSHMPLTYHAFSLVIAVGTMAQFSAAYFIMRVIFKSVGYAFVGMIVILLLNLFATSGLFQYYPSVGPLRFGLCYLLVVAILLRLKYPRARRGWIGLEYAVLGLASIWSFETFVYVATIFAVSRVYQTLADWQNSRSFIRQLLMKLGMALASIALFQAAQALYVYFQAGQWPNWGIYLNYLLKYSADGLGTLPVDPWSSWFFLVIVYFIYIMSVGLTWMSTRRLNKSLEIQTLLNLSFMGIAQLTYFVGRSHPNNLLHICVPAVMIALYGFQHIRSLNGEDFSGFTRSTMFGFYTGLALIAIIFFPKFSQKLPYTAYPMVQALVDSPATAPAQIKKFLGQEIELIASHRAPDEQINETVQLIHKYAEQQPRVAVFITPLGTTQAVILSKKAHIYPLNDPVEDSLSPQIVQRILDSPTELKAGDTIFLINDPSQLNINKINTGCQQYAKTPNACIQILQKVVNQLCGQFGFDEMERGPKGITAMRLVPPGSGTSDYCSRLAAVSEP